MPLAIRDRKILWARSGNRCAFPGCAQELVERGYGQAANIVIGEEAHISARRPSAREGLAQEATIPMTISCYYAQLIAGSSTSSVDPLCQPEVGGTAHKNAAMTNGHHRPFNKNLRDIHSNPARLLFRNRTGKGEKPIMLTLVQHMDCRLIYRNKVASMTRIRLEQPVTLRK